MKPTILLDTNILIDHLRGNAKASVWLRSQREGSLAISIISRSELLSACRDELAEREARQFLDFFPMLPLDAVTADLAAKWRRGKCLKLPDAFQAALSEQHHLKLATRNTRDFDPGQYPFVLLPY